MKFVLQVSARGQAKKNLNCPQSTDTFHVYLHSQGRCHRCKCVWVHICIAVWTRTGLMALRRLCVAFLFSLFGFVFIFSFRGQESQALNCAAAQHNQMMINSERDCECLCVKDHCVCLSAYVCSSNVRFNLAVLHLFSDGWQCIISSISFLLYLPILCCQFHLLC